MNKVSDPNIHHGRFALRRPPKSCEARFRHLVVICGRSELQRIRAELATLGLSYEASRSDLAKLFKRNWQSITESFIHNTPCWRSSCQSTNVPAKGSHKRLETEILICSNACICLTQRANPGLTNTGEIAFVICVPFNFNSLYHDPRVPTCQCFEDFGINLPRSWS